MKKIENNQNRINSIKIKQTMSRYVSISYDKFKSLMDQMGFIEINLDGTFERVWKFEIANTNFDIRVYSTISVNDDMSRDSGKDAIRCMIYDRSKDKILRLEKRVHRTMSALPNTRLRCRELFKHVRANKCICGGVLVERKSKTNHSFLGCSNYPICKNSKNINNPQLKLNLNKI